MNTKSRLVSIALGLLVASAAVTAYAAAKPLMVHYMPWFTAKPYIVESSNLVSWKTVKTYNADTNLITFSTNISTQAGSKYYMIRNIR